MASMIITPGKIGMPGKWPWNCGSLKVMHLMPTQLSFSTISLDLVDQQERIAVRDDPLDQIQIGGCGSGCIHGHPLRIPGPPALRSS
jgi:hypothetical protein